jgi:hypothetical protein
MNANVTAKSKTKHVSPSKRTKHHRKPICAGGNGKSPNLSYVRHADHVAFHRLFGPGLPQVIVAIINDIWIDPDYELVVRRRKKPLTANSRFRTGSTIRR